MGTNEQLWRYRKNSRITSHLPAHDSCKWVMTQFEIFISIYNDADDRYLLMSHHHHHHYHWFI